MVKEIRIYVEGDPSLREGFGAFFGRLRELARKRRIRWHLVPCRSRNSTFDDFMIALETHPEAFNVLLVDSEGPVSLPPWKHLQSQGWETKDLDDKNCHLMVQIMEAWFVADLDALRNFYREGFNTNVFPKRSNVEEIEKTTIEAALKSATRQASKFKDGYHKTRHAPKILELLSEEKVRKAAPHCERLFNTIEDLIGTSPA